MPKALAQRAVQLDPKNAVAWDRLGVALSQRGIIQPGYGAQLIGAPLNWIHRFAAAYAHLARAPQKNGTGAESPPFTSTRSNWQRSRPLVLIAESPLINRRAGLFKWKKTLASFASTDESVLQAEPPPGGGGLFEKRD